MHASRRPASDEMNPRRRSGSIMNPYLGQRYEGPDENGAHVSGVVWHVGSYDKDARITSYVLLLDNSPSQSAAGKRQQTGTAIVSADDLARHVEGIALCKSMERDKE
jgi:hypothetical protein